jgi:Tfp pilus assembly protein PilN
MNTARASPGRESPERDSPEPVTPGRLSQQRGQPAAAGSLLANLADSPFVNKRPVQRFVVAAWVAGALLTGVNVLLWVQYRHQSTALRGRLTEARASIERTSKRIVDMDAQLKGLRLPAQNAQVEFLNDRIAERTFPWSLLFERIATTLPDGVRLMSLSPVFRARSDAPERKRKKEDQAPPVPEDEVINLKIQGAAKTDDSLYQLIDAFFASPAFAHPRLFNERSTAAEVEFSVEVDYKPRFTDDASHQPAAAREADAGAESLDEDLAGGSHGEEADPAAEEADASAGSSSGDPAADEPQVLEVSE